VDRDTEGIAGDQSGPLWRCTVATARNQGQATIYLADLPEGLRSQGVGRRVACNGVFVKSAPGRTSGRTAVFVASRLEWRSETLLGDLGMDAGLLEGIRDNVPLTAAEAPAFYRVLILAKQTDPARLAREAQRLDADLAAKFLADPSALRGKLLRVVGTARRAVRVPIADPAEAERLGTDHYYEVELAADEIQNNPLTFCTLDLPAGMPLGGPPAYRETVDVTGFFLKTWRFSTSLSEGEKAAHPGSVEALQTAPLVIGPAPLWHPAAKTEETSAAAFGGLVVLVMIGVCLLLWWLRQSDQQFWDQRRP
jgi:hypothetical protein